MVKMHERNVAILMRSGFRREAVDVMRAHARLLRQFADDSHAPDAKKKYFLKVCVFTIIASLVTIVKKELVVQCFFTWTILLFNLKSDLIMFSNDFREFKSVCLQFCCSFINSNSACQ